MGNTLLLILLVASSMEMAICFGCFMVLLQFRHQTWDLPRRILAFLTVFCGIMAFYRVFNIVYAPQNSGFLEVVPPLNVLLVVCTQAFLYFYPRTLMDSRWLRWNNRGIYWILAPLVVIGIAYLFFIGHWTRLTSFQDITEHMTTPDVLLRILTVDVMIPYSILYLFLPYNWRRSTAPHNFIVIYAIGAFGFCTLHAAFFFTGRLPIRIVQQVWEMVFMVIACNFELKDRIIVRKPEEQEANEEALELEETWGEVALWDRIQILITKDQVWRNPDLTLPLMAQFCGTNITYLSNTIKENTGSGFSAYINKLRIQYITENMKQDPTRDMQQLCYEAGYRSRTTAWRNFKDIMGITPTEFRQTLGR